MLYIMCMGSILSSKFYEIGIIGEEMMGIGKYWRQILAWGLCFSLAAGLFYIVREDRKKYMERMAQLQQQASELEKTDSEKLEALTDIYDKFYSQVSVRNIICWGDSAMAGNKEKSLADSLKKVVDDNLFSSLSKSFGKILDKEEYSTPSVTVHNMGVTNETMRHILVRAGVNSIELGDWIQIPADIDPVTVRLMDEEAWDSEVKDDQIRFARQRDVSFGQVWINDIEGTLIATDDWFDSLHPRYAFVRDEEGSKESAGSGTEVEIESATMYIGDVPIFFFENETGRSVDGFVSDVQELVDRYANTEDDEEEEEVSYELPFVVIFATIEGSEMDKAMRTAFGSRYIRNDGFSSEMTDRMYKKLAQQVYDNLDSQGCFDSVKEKIALAIQKAEGL